MEHVLPLTILNVPPTVVVVVEDDEDEDVAATSGFPPIGSNVTSATTVRSVAIIIVASVVLPSVLSLGTFILSKIWIYKCHLSDSEYLLKVVEMLYFSTMLVLAVC